MLQFFPPPKIKNMLISSLFFSQQHHLKIFLEWRDARKRFKFLHEIIQFLHVIVLKMLEVTNREEINRAQGKYT